MAIKPVAIPVSADEVKLIQRRQATLVMQMNKIDEAVRSGKYSKAEGENRKMFLKSEVADLDYLKSQRRAPPSAPFQPAPKPSPPRSTTGQSSKYNSTATSGQTRVGKGTDAYSTNTKPVNTGTAKKLTIRDIPKHIGKSYGSIIDDRDARSAGGYFYAYQYTGRTTGRKYTIYYGAVSNSGAAITKFRDWNRIHLGKEYTTFRRPKTTSTKAKPQSATQKPKEPQYKNTNGKNYGTSLSPVEVVQTGGWYVEYNGSFYGPKFSNFPSKRKQYQEAWKKWNSERGIRYGRTNTPISVKKTSTTSSRSTSSRSTSSRSTSSRKTLKDNPYGYDYGTYYSKEDRALSLNKAKKDGSRYYGPKFTTKTNTIPFTGKKVTVKLPSPTNASKWESWNRANLYSSSSSTSRSTSSTRRKTVKDNPYTYRRTSTGYGRSVSYPEKAKMAYRDGLKIKNTGTIKYGGNHYGPTNGKEKEWLAWNKAHGISGPPSAMIHREKQQHRRRANRRRRAEQVVDPSTRARANEMRQTSMLRKRAGSRLDINRAGGRKAPNWKSFANTQEKQMIQQGLTMVGLTEMPKLTERGNEVLVQAIRTNRIENPQKKMEVGTRRMGRVLTELINNSGYFAVKYKAKVSPTFPPQVQLSEMAGIAGGFSKTRNSMQRLLRK